MASSPQASSSRLRRIQQTRTAVKGKKTATGSTMAPAMSTRSSGLPRMNTRSSGLPRLGILISRCRTLCSTTTTTCWVEPASAPNCTPEFGQRQAFLDQKWTKGRPKATITPGNPMLSESAYNQGVQLCSWVADARGPALDGQRAQGSLGSIPGT